MDERKRISDRLLIEIVLKHKEKIIESEKMQQDVNKVIEDFINKTGRHVSQIKIENLNGAYKLKLEVK